MKQQQARKLNLGKKTIARLNEAEAKAAQGGSIYISAGCTYSAGCGSDFTRPGTSVMTGGSSVRP